jgi:hypothetical protein
MEDEPDSRSRPVGRCALSFQLAELTAPKCGFRYIPDRRRRGGEV